MWPGRRPITVPSFILIHPTVWPQYTNVTDRQDRTGQTDIQWSDSTVTQKLAIIPHKLTKSHIVALVWIKVKDLGFENVRLHRFHEAHRRHDEVGCTNQLQQTQQSVLQCVNPCCQSITYEVQSCSVNCDSITVLWLLLTES